jgi:hypothetical protein
VLQRENRAAFSFDEPHVALLAARGLTQKKPSRSKTQGTFTGSPSNSGFSRENCSLRYDSGCSIIAHQSVRLTIMPLSQLELRTRAEQFSRDWVDARSERADAQTFWNEFFNIFGISRRRVATFEEPVRLLGDRRGSIDLFWPGTLIVEHKSAGEDLDRAYRQAIDYFPGLEEARLPKYVLVSDFQHFRLHDLETGEGHDFSLAHLSQNLHYFGFITGYQRRQAPETDPVNAEAAIRIGILHDRLVESGFVGHALEMFLVRIVYCRLRTKQVSSRAAISFSF